MYMYCTLKSIIAIHLELKSNKRGEIVNLYNFLNTILNLFVEEKFRKNKINNLKISRINFNLQRIIKKFHFNNQW